MSEATHRADLALQEAKQQGRGRAVAVPLGEAATHAAVRSQAAPDPFAAQDGHVAEPDTDATDRRRRSDGGPDAPQDAA